MFDSKVMSMKCGSMVRGWSLHGAGLLPLELRSSYDITIIIEIYLSFSKAKKM